MHGYISRFSEKQLGRALARSPAVAILGPRQCGKTTLAKAFLATIPSVYLDLQDRVARNKLAEPELFFEQHRSELICLDEIQRMPEFFSALRAEIDHDRRPGRFPHSFWGRDLFRGFSPEMHDTRPHTCRLQPQC